MIAQSSIFVNEGRSQRIHISFTEYSPIFFKIWYDIVVARNCYSNKYITPSLKTVLPNGLLLCLAKRTKLWYNTYELCILVK